MPQSVTVNKKLCKRFKYFKQTFLICEFSFGRKSFYITNKSGSEQLDEIVKEYFQKAGIDHVYFISTKDITNLDDGAIDCMTQEK